MSRSMKFAIGSLILGLAVLGLKTVAAWLTGSVALMADALESIVNVATALAAMVAIRVAAIPPDDNHPYGHHKAEFFSAVLEGVLIVIAALFILRDAWGNLFAPLALVTPGMGLAISILATALNAGWAFVLIREGRKMRSPALVADGRHLLADVITSVGVTVGLVLAIVTGWWLLDPLMAIVVALNILWSGGRVILESLSGLMDEAVPPRMMEQVRAAIAAEAGGALEAHDLRTRHAGPVTFIDFHLVVPGEMSVFDSHEICDRIEERLRNELGEARISIHVEPGFKSKAEIASAEVITPQ
ncbi:cation diffusion facilitator family transporter [Rhodalgimonas zhirmunskyi]|uniref:Cation diffusion facilitator family transporter n=1 Tax=Rhodalgimonas zhirmunskyi TaxID=2964767 RepID=A0AAJ1UDR6_9RHOB|nr:cation diffusion facilitator family transporter [Rhodoalgimonas zhirmunskyi]MDQ2094137.1 cation diffusion facilitator family transporter [Rhodoalgimonas zhirmunskyi]